MRFCVSSSHFFFGRNGSCQKHVKCNTEFCLIIRCLTLQKSRALKQTLHKLFFLNSIVPLFGDTHPNPNHSCLQGQQVLMLSTGRNHMAAIAVPAGE